MDIRRPLLASLLAAGPAVLLAALPAAAQTAAAQTAAAQTAAAQTAAAQTDPAPVSPAPAGAPAPMPDPLMSPDLQRPARTPSLANLVSQASWQDPVIAAARTQVGQLPFPCPTATYKPTGQLTIYAPPRFDSQGTLVEGIWSERVAETGCNASHALNVLTVLQAGSPPSRIPTMPGSTHADPATQKSALQYAQAVAIRASPPGCTRQSFVDTRFDGYTGLPNAAITDGRESRAWREVWTLSACGSTYEITLTFTPNAQGTQLLATNPIKRS